MNPNIPLEISEPDNVLFDLSLLLLAAPDVGLAIIQRRKHLATNGKIQQPSYMAML
jgi:hypothetical protein